MRTRKTLASVVALLLLATCATASRRPGEGPPRNVIVLVWDGLRPDFIGPDTPNLVALRSHQFFLILQEIMRGGHADTKFHLLVV